MLTSCTGAQESEDARLEVEPLLESWGLDMAMGLLVGGGLGSWSRVNIIRSRIISLTTMRTMMGIKIII